MSGWSKRESLTLAADLGRQGATVVSRKNGFTVRFPDGKSTMSIHMTPSDHRTRANYRADVLRAGFKWPFDGEGFRKQGREKAIMEVLDAVHEAEDKGEIAFIGKALVNTATAESPAGDFNPVDEHGRAWYPRTVTEGGRPSGRTLGLIRGALAATSQRRKANDFALRTFLAGHDAPMNIDTIRRTLYWLGYRFDPETVKRVTRGYQGAWRLVPELDRAQHETLPIRSFTKAKPKPVSTGGEAVESEDIGAQIDELQKPLTVSEPDPALAAAEELLREAERERDEAQQQLLPWMEAVNDRDREVKRLQGELARERSAPKGLVEDGSWSVPAEDFLPSANPNGVAYVPVTTFAAAGLDVRVLFVPKARS